MVLPFVLERTREREREPVLLVPALRRYVYAHARSHLAVPDQFGLKLLRGTRSPNAAT